MTVRGSMPQYVLCKKFINNKDHLLLILNYLLAKVLSECYSIGSYSGFFSIGAIFLNFMMGSQLTHENLFWAAI